MTPAVCGFLFSQDRQRVVLIRKNRPTWQRGYLNGVGGKIDPGEDAPDAMHREFVEEAGLHLEWRDWFCVLKDEAHGFHVSYFRSFGDVDRCRSTTDEELVVLPLDELDVAPLLPNLRWLIPMALDPNLSFATTKWVSR